jgi:ribosomal protein L21
MLSPTLLLLYKEHQASKLNARKAKPRKERKRRKGLREKSIER